LKKLRALIICAGDNKNSSKLKAYAKNSDYIICADGGYLHAKENSIIPNIIVGDFDSCSAPEDFSSIVKLPQEKDETDSFYALKFALSKGAKEIVLYGGIGDRFDHSYANMCLLNFTLERNIKTVLTDGKTEIYLIDSSISLNKKKGTAISIYSYTDISYNVCYENLKYKLNNYTLSKSDIIGTSNEFLDKQAKISVEIGKLIIICN
jgi:thiamine pyrophosphokinase